MQQALRAYAASDNVQGMFPRARIGCAIAYDVDFEKFNVDLAPGDMPASQNTVATVLGGVSSAYFNTFKERTVTPAFQGRYQPTWPVPKNYSNSY